MATCFPPTHHHSHHRIPLSHAHTLVAAYLSASATDPSLHPNALLTENGPITPNAGSNTGLVLHNLKRVEAGLRGEYLGAYLELGKKGALLEDLDGALGVVDDTTKRNEERGMSGEGRTGGTVEAEEDWQDRSEFEREQEDLQGEIGEREHGGPDGVAVPKVKKGSMSKDARKAAKMERRKRENKERAEQVRREREAEKS